MMMQGCKRKEIDDDQHRQSQRQYVMGLDILHRLHIRNYYALFFLLVHYYQKTA